MKTYITVLAIIFFSQLGYSQTQSTFTPTFIESDKPTHQIPSDQEFTFGYLEVLENRNDSGSRTIKLPIYIFKSRSSNPKPDPIIYTVGGPGSTTMPSAQYMNYYKYLDDRDFILIEQRGNFYAKPHLDCPEWAESDYKTRIPGFDENKSKILFEDSVRECRKRLIDAGIDLNGYNTNEIAADILDLTKALNITNYNLLTISYSTKITQVLLRDYPNGIRSVVMDSPIPLEVNYDEESITNLMHSIQIILSDCASNLECNNAYPDLEQRLFRYLREKSIQPLLVKIDNNKNVQPQSYELRGQDLISVFTLASTGDVPYIPYEINKLLNNDLGSLKEQLANLSNQKISDGAGIGMRLSVWCAEEFPFNDPDEIEEESQKFPEVRGLSSTVFDAEICSIWDVETKSELENKAIKSDIPVLLISGEYDNETPPKWATMMNNNLANSYHIIFKGWKHTPTTNWGNQCAMEVANVFFNNPTESPTLECFEMISKPDFFVE